MKKSNQYRKEATANFTRSQNFSKLASWTKQHARSINANLNQEYVGWLQKQSLPNSSGSMGINEAQTILSARPTLDHSYQQRFMEGKLQNPSSVFKNHGLASSNNDIQQTYIAVQSGIQNSVSKQPMREVSAHVSTKGLDDNFKVESSQKGKTIEKLENIERRLNDHQNRLKQEAQMRESEVLKR